jgi:hypothetical protein
VGETGCGVDAAVTAPEEDLMTFVASCLFL